ncbi:MAG: alpha/beta hydrolase [Lysobacteraceae bacterium]|nr:MAG: alpha/beta hydrolase [Xanthomonadaceae bacterium]
MIDMETIDVKGVGLELQRLDAPPGLPPRAPLVFLHEGLGSVAMWRDWPRLLCDAAGRAGIVYSRQGYGASDTVPDVRGTSAEHDGSRRGRLRPDYMHHEAWTVLPALLQALGIEKPVLVGHSDGGTIALLHAARHPVEACVVMAPHVMVEDVSLQSIETARDAYTAGALRERLAKYHADVDTAFWQWNDVWLSDGFRSFDIRAECRAITAPVLALQGEDDPYGSMAQILEIEPAGPMARLALAGCGHSPHRDQPEQTTAAIRNFLR